jgi:3-oxoacyl-[acyl-carrier protein] reductase
LLATRDELAKQFPSQKVLAKICDVSSETQVNELVAFALHELGPLHALVLNAGIYGPMGATESVSLEEWRRAMDINLYGVLLPCRAVIPHFKKSGHGKIVILSGGGATNPLPNISAYAASKAAVIRLMETLAEELKTFRVDVNAIAPGALATRLVDEVLAAGPEKVGAAFYEKNKQWKDKGATPLELGANLAVYLASAQSDGITGKLISAQWDPWEKLHELKGDLSGDIYTLRRIVPKDRGKTWGDK